MAKDDHEWHDYDINDGKDWEVRRRVEGVEIKWDIRSFIMDRQCNGLDDETWDKVRSGEIDEMSLPFTPFEREGVSG